MRYPWHDPLAAQTHRAWAALAHCLGDRSGLLAAAILAAAAAAYTLLRENLPGLALDCALHAVLALALAELQRRRPQHFFAHRTPLLAACSWNGVRVTFRLIFDNGWHVHPGSSLAHRLALVAAVSPAPWLAWLLLFHAPSHRSALLILPLLTTLPVYHIPRLCAALLRGSPGLRAWCDDAHRTLWVFHAATFPVTPFPAAGGSDPQTQCLVVSAWACILTGVVLPLLALHEIERRAEQQHRAAAAAAAAGAAAAAEPGCVLPRRRRRASQSTLASVPENIIAEESMMAEKEVAEEAPLQAQAGPAQQEEEQVAAPAAATEADGPAEAGPLLQEANFLQWCLRPYFYSSLAWSAVALVLPALPLAVDGSADGPAGNSPVG